MLDDRQALQLLTELVTRIAPYAALNGLAQTLLRLTVPGVPDLYQGTEFWDLSLVDPDNRRPVDHPARRLALDAAASGAGPITPGLIDHWQDGHLKQALIAAALALRKALPDVFETGSYERLTVAGPQADSAFAFARRASRQVVIVIVTRLAARADKELVIPRVAVNCWQQTAVLLPDDAPAVLVDALGATAVPVRGGRLLLSDAFLQLPVALLHYLA